MQNKKEQREQLMVMIEDWQSSALNQRDYCATKKVAYHVFHYWYGVYRKKKTDTGTFLPMKITSTPIKEQLTIIGTSGIKVQLPLTEKSIAFVKLLLLA